MSTVVAPAERKRFRHEGEAARRAALVSAALEAMAEGGVMAATVRAIAVKAGVTPGLIRHYFPSKDELLAAAYQDLMDRLTAPAAAAETAPGSDRARLGRFIRAALGTEATDPAALAAWAGFIGALHRDPRLKEIHVANYLDFRSRLERLIAAALAASGRTTGPGELRAFAIGVNAILDGLWLEGGLAPEGFAPGELAGLGIAAAESILNLSLGDDPE